MRMAFMAELCPGVWLSLSGVRRWPRARWPSPAVSRPPPSDLWRSLVGQMGWRVKMRVMSGQRALPLPSVEQLRICRRV
eukprot:2838712-Pyramimonas_sp.AAC.1